MKTKRRFGSIGSVSSEATLTGYDGAAYQIGDRVEVHPGTDLWMRGARYGEVVGTSLTPQDRVKVKLDKTGARVWSGPEDMFRRIA